MQDVYVRLWSADLVEGDVHGEEVEGGVVVHVIGVGFDYPGAFAEAGVGEGLEGEGCAGGVVFYSKDLGIREAVGVVDDAVSGPGADVQDVEARHNGIIG